MLKHFSQFVTVKSSSIIGKTFFPSTGKLLDSFNFIFQFFDVSFKIYESFCLLSMHVTHLTTVTSHHMAAFLSHFTFSLEILCFPVYPPGRGPRTWTPASLHWTGSLTVKLPGKARAPRGDRGLALVTSCTPHPELGQGGPAPE